MKGLMGLPTMGLLKLTNQLGTKGVRRRKKLKSSHSGSMISLAVGRS